MRTAIVVLGCLFVSATLAGEQAERNAASHAKAKPAVAEKARAKGAVQTAKAEGADHVWTVEMACCEAK